MTIQEITPIELINKLNQQDKLFLLDVREANEVAICGIHNAIHIPMNTIPLYLDKIPDEIDIVIYCHHGRRSLAVVHFLVENGFDPNRLYNLAGGIDAWAVMIDKQMPRY
ncbi:rhodanese-like domain-containing protein [Gilliamella sp. WF3-4]|uniref:rhodanese-like domain-containing protein n=1 Tax=Gilliamella sp. WF3-4 TaxID=3120255 RepID=UPI00080DED52|nr:rhodanese-like domain-containing protein [Gilliamella apicola]OCG15771.1 hypothetical protein A9G47_02045 [Gilliamella apicola]